MFEDIKIELSEATKEGILKDKKEFDTILRDTGREGVEELILELERMGFYTAPASTRYHLAVDGGLVHHSLNVRRLSRILADSLDPEYLIPRESVDIAALLHDVGKAGYYGEQYYVENILKNGTRGATPYNKGEALPIPHEIVSVETIKEFIKLTGEEVYAVYHHNGLYGPLYRELRNKERPLQMIVHMADMWASRVIEKTCPEQVTLLK